MLSVWQKPPSLMENDEKGLLEKLPIAQWHFFSVMFTVLQNNVFFSVDKSAVCHQKQGWPAGWGRWLCPSALVRRPPLQCCGQLWVPWNKSWAGYEDAQKAGAPLLWRQDKGAGVTQCGEKKVPRRFWSPFRSFRDFRASKEATRIAGEGFLQGHYVMVEWFESERGELQTKC